MNAHGKTVDTTYLSIETAEERGFIHRDYIAHCLRWSHVVKRLTEQKNYAEAIILDIGCGRELPLATTLYSSRLIPRGYIGVDVGPVLDSAMEKFHSGKMPLRIFERTDILAMAPVDFIRGRPNYVTCFEMLEHIEPGHMLKVLDHIKTLVDPQATLFFSTPCWNGQDTAANHVNEMTFEALAAAFEAAGYEISCVHGTFASIRDYQSHLERFPGLRTIFDSLRGYYDVNILSCIFAPLFPEYSRNALWELRILPQARPQAERRYPAMLKCRTPWGSSAKWREMDRESFIA